MNYRLETKNFIFDGVMGVKDANGKEIANPTTDIVIEDKAAFGKIAALIHATVGKSNGPGKLADGPIDENHLVAGYKNLGVTVDLAAQKLIVQGPIYAAVFWLGESKIIAPKTYDTLVAEIKAHHEKGGR